MAVILSGLQYVNHKTELPWLIIRLYNSPFIIYTEKSTLTI